MRISGLASGMDTDSMIKDLMKAERVPMDRLIAKKTTLGWQQEAFRNMNSKFLDFRSITQELRFESAFMSQKATSSSDAVRVSQNGSTSSGTHTIEVSQLASFGKTSSLTSVNSATNTGLKGSAITTPLTIGATNNSFTLELGGVTKTITLANNTYDSTTLVTEMKSKIDQAFGAGKISVGMNGSSQLELTPSGASGYEPQLMIKDASNSALSSLGFINDQSYKIDPRMKLQDLKARMGDTFIFDGSNNLNFTVNGVAIQAASTDTIQSLMDKVNASAAGVNMSFDVQSGKFSFISKTTGSNSVINLQDTDFIRAIGFSTAASQNQVGKDAILTIDGLATQRNTNSFTENGISYTVTATTASPVTVTVEQNTDVIFDKIKKFVDKYNELVAEISTKTTEKKYRDYQPLTDEQKEGMSEKQIELWDEKAKSGLLRSDTLLISARDEMRLKLLEPVEGLTGFKTLKEIGISTSDNYMDNGKLSIDESKLKDMITSNPDQIKALFMTTVNDGNYRTNGFAQRLYDQINNTMDGINKKAGYANSVVDLDTSTLGKEMTRINEQISVWEEKLSRKESLYYKQFTAMEKMLSQLNSQSSWLMSQMGAGGST